jgi:uncharacterized protein (TIGR02145 family)
MKLIPLFLFVIISSILYSQNKSNIKNTYNENFDFSGYWTWKEPGEGAFGKWTFDISIIQEKDSIYGVFFATAQNQSHVNSGGGSFGDNDFNAIGIVKNDTAFLKYSSSWSDEIGEAIIYSVSDSLIVWETTYEPKSSQGNWMVKRYDLIRNNQGGIIIGNQIWMDENLNVSTFRNGDIIPEAKSNEEWKRAGETGKPAWCYYNNDPENGAIYGKLYNWFAVNDPRGLAPLGWHIPNGNDWWSMYDLGFEHLLGKAMKSKLRWKNEEKGSDEIGFNALPAGMRFIEGDFFQIGENTFWWFDEGSTRIYGSDPGFYFYSGFIEMFYDDRSNGYSVRCVKD